MRRPALLALLLLLFACPVHGFGTQLTVRLAPQTGTLALRAYAFRVMPVTVTVARFAGTLIYDPADLARCKVQLTAEVASVESTNATTRDAILGPEFLDAARFPTLSFAGSCAAHDTMAGDLTMRGVTRPLKLALDWRQHRLVAHGELRRADWGMNGRPFIVGPIIGIRMAADLP